ncbi:FAD-dependent monooxygenase [Streptomyces sp. NPDC098781]|uniref:FAD-dependent monooxygenase n=1 Tax=Streptomyces sp. NPDC098781 TaxID=3366097 RepID=UPI0038279B2F
MSNESSPVRVSPRPQLGVTAPDVLVAGGGPAGCTAALAFANAGARTALLDAAAPAARRLAGEWLHPPGVRILERLGVDLSATDHCRVAGFVVHPEDGSTPITLPYSGGELGMTFRHGALVRELRSTLARRRGVTLVSHARITGVRGTHVDYADADGSSASCAPSEWLVGAEGRVSPTRRSLGVAPKPRQLSHMAGVLLENVELPDAEYGHVLLGGPGPVLLYHIGPGVVRVCLDVPRRRGTPHGVRAYLWQTYSSWFPPTLRAAFGRALQGEVCWAATQFRPRDHYGRGRVALVGDAVGCFHPLTAVGMTLAMADGECLVRSEDLGAYRRERTAATQVAEILSTLLHRVFTSRDPATEVLRHAVYDMWRRSPVERERTMALLSTDETRVRKLGAAFLHTLALAAREPSLRRPSSHDGPAWSSELLRGLGGWLSLLGMSTGHAAARRAAVRARMTGPVR